MKIINILLIIGLLIGGAIATMYQDGFTLSQGEQISGLNWSENATFTSGAGTVYTLMTNSAPSDNDILRVDDASKTIQFEAMGTGLTQVTPAATSVIMDTGDEATYEDFTISGFTDDGYGYKLKIMANFTTGQQTVPYAAVNDATYGFNNSTTTLAFDGKSGTFVNGDFYWVGNEIIKINDADPNTSPIVVARGQKGTKAASHANDEQIIACNEGFSLLLCKDTNRYPKETILRLRNIKTATATTDAATIEGENVLSCSAELKNVDDWDLVRVEDSGSEEELRVIESLGDVEEAAQDYTVWLYDTTAAHDASKPVMKVCEYDIPWSMEDATSTTLYGRLIFAETSMANNINVTMWIEGEDKA